MKTACEMAKIKPPKQTDSVSFLPTLEGKTNEQDRHKFLYWEFYERTFRQAVVMEEWKLIRSGMDNSKIELYDLYNDIHEERTTCVLNTLQLPKDLSHIWKKHINHIRTGKLRDRQKNNLIYCRASRPRLSFRELFSYRPDKELREYQTILLSYSLQKNTGIT